MGKKVTSKFNPAKLSHTPGNFVDEDIDDDLAFDSEDERLYGNALNGGDNASDGELLLEDLLEKPKAKAKAKGKLRLKAKTARIQKPEEQLFSDKAKASKKSVQSPHASLDSLIADIGARPGCPFGSGKKAKRIVERLKVASGNDRLLKEDISDEEKGQIHRKQTRATVARDHAKWNAALSELKNARHVVFPLASKTSRVKDTLGQVAAKASESPHCGGGSMLSDLNKTLVASGLSSPNPPGPDIGYIRYLKSAMHYELVKRRRLNKIKSSAYRRILRRQRDRHVALGCNVPRDQVERQRILERTTQRHKNTSKWVRHIKRLHTIDDPAKEALQVQLSEHQRLMQKMDQDALDETSSRQTSGDEEVANRETDQLMSTQAHSLLHDRSSFLWDQASTGNHTTETAFDSARQNLLEMNFMKKGREKRAEQTKEHTELVEDTRAYHTTGALPPDLQRVDPSLKPELTEELQHSYTDNYQPLQKGLAALQATESTTQATPQSLNQIPGKKKYAAKTNVGVPQTVDISVNPKLSSNAPDMTEVNIEEQIKNRETVIPSSQIKKSIKFQEDPTCIKNTAENMVCERITNEMESNYITTNSIDKDAEQNYLVARAFAEDDIDAELHALKEREVESIMKPQQLSENLPGWGEWGGNDEVLNKKFKQKLAEETTKRMIEKKTLMKGRIDFQHKHLIVNQEGFSILPTGKKSANNKYTVKLVPRPFASAQEFQRSQRQPIGPEWNTPISFRDGVKPQIETIPGSIIQPLNKATAKIKSKVSLKK